MGEKVFQKSHSICKRISLKSTVLGWIWINWQYLLENCEFNFKKNVSPFCRKSAVVSQATNLITFLSYLAQCVEGFSEGAFKYFNAHSFFTRDLWNSQAWWINIVHGASMRLLKVPKLESFQDYLIKLDMKPCMHLV